MSYELVYTRQARKDAKKLKGTPLAMKAKELLKIIQEDPFADPPPFEGLSPCGRGSGASPMART